MIERVQRIEDAFVAEVARLLPQLTIAAPPTRTELEAIVASPDAYLLAARDGALLGIAILNVYRIPTGVQARIDDVVVDTAARGRGIGEALTRACLDHARAANAKSVSLTSRPDREAANRLYRRMGFELLATNAYRFKL